MDDRMSHLMSALASVAAGFRHMAELVPAAAGLKHHAGQVETHLKAMETFADPFTTAPQGPQEPSQPAPHEPAAGG